MFWTFDDIKFSQVFVCLYQLGGPKRKHRANFSEKNCNSQFSASSRCKLKECTYLKDYQTNIIYLLQYIIVYVFGNQ